MLSKPISPHVRRIYSALDAPRLDTQLGVDTEIAYSWRRCLSEFGLDPSRVRHRPHVLDASSLRDRRESMASILEIARPELDNLYKQIQGSGFCILLTDQEGVVVEALADEGNRRDFERAGLWLGADWSERSEGTNGIGTAISEQRPVTVHLEDHFQPKHTALTCSGAPLYGPNGDVIGVLDVSSTNSRDSKQGQRATLALVNMTNTIVANGLFMKQYRDQFILRLHPNRQYVGLVCEGLIALSGEGRVLAMNRSATQLLGFENTVQAVGKPLDGLFENEFNALIKSASENPASCFQLRALKSASTYFARLEIPSKIGLAVPSRGAPAETPRPVSSQRRPCGLRLSELSHGDTAMAHVINCAERVMNRDIPILIQGQTGSGKEALAKAIHLASDRCLEPFIAVNCASIPESLIESELFGYKSGAFTGARREGMRGKLVQSSGGTLFLDEIGDMPLPLQTRLLRVLEDGLVFPLGSEAPIPVQLNIIAATHQDLETMVEEGRFRQDLYFRLNGISLHVPSLRERSDIRYLIDHLIAEEAESEQVVASEEVLQILSSYDWPGNIRQLRNVVRVSLALCDHKTILPDHLPVEIRRAVAGTTAVRQLPPANGGRAAEVQGNGFDRALASAERQTLLAELERYKWNVSRTAVALGISRATLYRKMKRHGMDKG